MLKIAKSIAQMCQGADQELEQARGRAARLQKRRAIQARRPVR